MNHQWCQKMIDRVTALEARVADLERPHGPEVDDAERIELTPESYTAGIPLKRKPGRPPKTEQVN